MAERAASVVVLGGGPGEGLVTALGTERARAVHELLLTRASAWARAVAEVVVVSDASTFREVLSDAPAASLPDGPAFVLAPELGVWAPELATAALGDLADGCALTLAPIFDGGLYLLALARPGSLLAGALAELDLAGARGMGELLRLSQRERWEVGLLRAERGLRAAGDVSAALADPLTDGELRGLLG